MEEVIVVIVQIFFEVGVQFFASPAVDVNLGEKANKGCFIVFLHMLVGGGLGWISTLIVPKLLLPNPTLRIVNLIVAPLLAAAIAWLIARKFTKQDPGEAALHGGLFALMYGLARFACGTR